MAKIGVVGVGVMGQGMAKSLLREGHDVYVFDVSREAMDHLVKIGASPSGSVGIIAEKCDFVVMSLPTPQIVENVVAGPEGLLTHARKGLTIIDASTIDPSTANAMEDFSKKKGVFYLDSPVSGGPKASEEGKLTIIVSGNEEGFKQAEPIIASMADKIYYVGASGRAQIIKLCHNALCAVISIALGEIFVTARKAEIDISTMADIIINSAGQNRILEINKLAYENNDHSNALFGLELMKKDVELYTSTIRALGVCGIFGTISADIYRSAAANGKNQHNFTAVIDSLAALNGIDC